LANERRDVEPNGGCGRIFQDRRICRDHSFYNYSLIARAFSLTIVGFRPETWKVWIMTETTATIRVECYSGHRGDEAPRRIRIAPWCAQGRMGDDLFW